MLVEQTQYTCIKINLSCVFFIAFQDNTIDRILKWSQFEESQFFTSFITSLCAFIFTLLRLLRFFFFLHFSCTSAGCLLSGAGTQAGVFLVVDAISLSSSGTMCAV